MQNKHSTSGSLSPYRTLSALLISGSCLLSPGLVLADWQLDGASSSLYYVTNKASAIAELNTFKRLSGSITDAGAASLEIDLASVDTYIEIRDERMREHLFETGKFATATVRLSVDAAALNALPVGGSTSGSYTATLDLHGVEQELTAELQVVKLADSSLQIQTLRPLFVNAAVFGMAGGVEQLREIAGLPSINPTAIVNFTLVYRP
jgi:polyisoprenoid-binding protein YceI